MWIELIHWPFKVEMKYSQKTIYFYSTNSVYDMNDLSMHMFVLLKKKYLVIFNQNVNLVFWWNYRFSNDLCQIIKSIWTLSLSYKILQACIHICLSHLKIYLTKYICPTIFIFFPIITIQKICYFCDFKAISCYAMFMYVYVKNMFSWDTSISAQLSKTQDSNSRYDNLHVH